MTSTDVIFTLVRAIIYQDLTKNLATHFWQHIIDMSGMFLVLVCIMLLVKGCQETVVMDPTSLLQQSLGNTVSHTMMVHTDIYSGQQSANLSGSDKNLASTFLATHHHH